MVIEQQEHCASKLCKAPSRIATEGYDYQASMYVRIPSVSIRPARRRSVPI